MVLVGSVLSNQVSSFLLLVQSLREATVNTVSWDLVYLASGFVR